MDEHIESDCVLIRLYKFAACGALCVVLFIPPSASGEAVVAPPPLKPPPPDAVNELDPPREYVSEKFIEWSQDIDRFFGSERNFQESEEGVMQLDMSRVTGYEGDSKYDVNLNANVSLPNTEKRFHLLLETNPDRNTTVDPSRARTPPIRRNTSPASYAAALRYEKKREAERWHFTVDGGIKMAGLDSTPFARTRASLEIPLNQWRFRAVEALFWFNNIGAGESTEINFERDISKKLLFRASNNSTWLHDTQNFDWRQDFSIFQKIDDRAALLYQASMIAVTQPKIQMTEYVMLVMYRYRLHRQWMFLELSPQIHYPRDRDFQTSTLFSMRMEILFDKSR